MVQIQNTTLRELFIFILFMTSQFADEDKQYRFIFFLNKSDTTKDSSEM